MSKLAWTVCVLICALSTASAVEPIGTDPLIERLVVVARKSEVDSKAQLGALWKLFLLGTQAALGDLKFEKPEQYANYSSSKYRVRRLGGGYFIIFGRSIVAGELVLLQEQAKDGARAIIPVVEASASDSSEFVFEDPADGTYLTGSGQANQRRTGLARYLVKEAKSAAGGSPEQKEAVYELFLMGTQIPLSDLPLTKTARSEVDSYDNPRVYRFDGEYSVFIGDRPAHRYAAILKTTRHGLVRRVTRVLDIRIDKDERPAFPFP